MVVPERTFKLTAMVPLLVSVAAVAAAGLVLQRLRLVVHLIKVVRVAAQARVSQARALSILPVMAAATPIKMVAAVPLVLPLRLQPRVLAETVAQVRDVAVAVAAAMAAPVLVTAGPAARAA